VPLRKPFGVSCACIAPRINIHVLST
jgi:hypothetical protein